MFKFIPQKAIKSAVVGATLAMSAFSLNVQASPVTWTVDLDYTIQLYGARNVDVSGTFVYDAATGVISDMNLSALISSLSSSIYSFTDESKFDVNGTTFSFFGDKGFGEASWTLSALLTNIGGTVNVTGMTGGTLTSGSLTGTPVSAVPVPAAAWLFGSGLMGLAALRQRKEA